MRTRLTAVAAALVLLSAPGEAMAQKQRFRLSDLVVGGDTYYQVSAVKTKYPTWWGDTCVRRETDRCLAVDQATGGERELFTLDRVNAALALAGAGAVGHLMGVTFPVAGEPLALVELPRRLALVDWEEGKVAWQAPLDPERSAQDWSARSRNLAFVKGHNLYVTTADGRTVAVSSDGSDDLRYGESVHRDEFGITKGTFWSDDGRRLAFYRMDQSMVSPYPQVTFGVGGDPSDGSSRCARCVPDRYPMAGEASHKVGVGVYDVERGTTVYLETGDPTDRYFTNIAWAPDGRTVYLVELNRDQNHACLDSYDAATGRFVARLYEETDEKYVEPLQPVRFLPWDASMCIYQTRRDGYNHLYLCRLTPTRFQVVRQLTRGAFEVIDLLGFNERERTAVYTSNEDDPIGCTLHAVDMSGRAARLGGAQGWHSAVLSPSGRYAIDRWSSPAVPGRIDIRPTARKGGDGLAMFAADDPWRDYDVPEMRVGTLKAADGVTDVYYRLVLPTGFDPSRKYPAVVYVYGGPHAHNIDAGRNWGARGWDVWMAQNGYVMFCLDNRGGEHRGKAFEQATFRRLGEEEMKDQLRGVDFLKSLPYVDAGRIGVHGWSFGGFMAANLMTSYPDVFRVGVAGGPVVDWRLYEVMYGERYMDTPQANPEGYARSSLLNRAGSLKGRLLVVYGGNDPTCVPQHALSFVRACIDAGTHPDLFTYPGDGHNMTGTDRVHLHEHISRYFDDFLKR